MAGVAGGELVTLPGWPGGINNVDKEHAVVAVPTRDGGTPCVREAENVDFDNQGKVRRRDGYARVITGDHVHSLWSHPDLSFGLFVKGGVLTAFDAELNETVIETGISDIHPLSYATVNGSVYWSSRKQHGRVTPQLTAAPFALASPIGQPAVSAAATGGLQGGTYQVAMTYIGPGGEETGTSLAVLVDVADGGGVQLSAIPQPTDLSMLAVRIYMTGANGDVLYHARDIPVGMTSTTLGARPLGKPLETQWLQPMPPGQIVRIQNGRALVASGNVLWWSAPFRYGYRNMARNYIRFKQGTDITLLAPVGDGDSAGRYVASGARTYWISGADPSAASQAIAYPYGAVPGTHLDLPATVLGLETSGRVAFWLADNGIPCAGLPGGQVLPLTDQRWVAPLSERGTAFLRERDGARHIVMGLGGQTRNGLRTTDRAVATVTRNGITLD